MRTHPLNPAIALPERLGAIKATRLNEDLCLKDEFQATYVGAIFKSPVLEALALKYSYKNLGYDFLKANEEYYERMVLAEVRKGRIGDIRQSTRDEDIDKFEVTELDEDLERFKPIWSNLFRKFAGEMMAVMGGDFELRIKCLTQTKLTPHTDPNAIIGILPLGKGRKATNCDDADGGMIEPEDGSLVVTTPGLRHTGPVSLIPRMGVAATKYSRHFL